MGCSSGCRDDQTCLIKTFERHKLKISERNLRRIIREELLKERIGTRAGKSSGRSVKDSLFGRSRKSDQVTGGNFIADIPPGTTTAHPVGKVGGRWGRLTSKAGPRKRPKAGASSMHKGRDYGVKQGTPILAYSDGEVVTSKTSGNAGMIMTVSHPFSWTDENKSGSVRTQYMHLSKFLKNPGDTVRAGEVIALSGNTGNSTGPHLHFTFTIGGSQSANDDLYAAKLNAATVIAVRELGDEISVADEKDEESESEGNGEDV